MPPLVATRGPCRWLWKERRAPGASAPPAWGRFLEIANFRLSDGGLPKGGTTAGALSTRTVDATSEYSPLLALDCPSC